MKKNPAVSVIMPSLNVGEYIQECLESVVVQTLREIEILCVDAGSTDGTLEIIEAFAAKDPRIKIIHSPIKSYGAQMNMGLDAAAGEYVGIVETDDLVAPEMFEKLYRSATQHDCDIVKADYVRFMGEWCKSVNTRFMRVCDDSSIYGKVFDPHENAHVLRFSINDAGIYKLAFLRDNQIRFHESPGASYQDMGFYFQANYCAHRMLFLKESFYRHRRDRPGSSVNSKGKVYAICDEFAFARRRLKETEQFDFFRPLFERDLYFAYWSNYRRIGSQHQLPFLMRASNELKELFLEDGRFVELFTSASRMKAYALMLSPLMFLYMTNKSWCIQKSLEAEDQDPRLDVIIAMTCGRIELAGVIPTVESLLRQSTLPSKIVIFVEQSFQEEDGSLPNSLITLCKKNNIELRYVECKEKRTTYEYAAQLFDKAIIIVVDRHIWYPANLVKELLNSYYLYPYAVSCGQACTLWVDKEGGFSSCEMWGSVSRFPNRPSMLTVPLEAGGVLYPPRCLKQSGSVHSDVGCVDADLWMKWGLLTQGIPCVYVPNLSYEKTSTGDATRETTWAQKDAYWASLVNAQQKEGRLIAYLLAQGCQASKCVISPVNGRVEKGPWVFRKALGLLLCVRENGVRYTIRHAKEKVYRFVVDRSSTYDGSFKQLIFRGLRCFWENGFLYTFKHGMKALGKKEVSSSSAIGLNDGPKVSVIVPVYNAEKTLRECLDSICSQTLKSIEIVCVDDGSTDASLQILMEYASRDARFKVTHQENLGVSYARNRALGLATGEFVVFMDPDDLYPADDVLAVLYYEVKRRHLSVVGGEVERFRAADPTKILFPQKQNRVRSGLHIYAENPFDYGYTRFIYDRRLLVSAHIVFPPYRRYQDPPFLVKALTEAKRYYLIQKSVYRYRINPGHVDWRADNWLRLRHAFLGMRDVALLAKENKLKNLRERIAWRIQKEYEPILRPIIEKVRDFPEFQSLLNVLPREAKKRILETYTVTEQNDHDTKRADSGTDLLFLRTMKGYIKQCIPYGIMCVWQRKRYGEAYWFSRPNGGGKRVKWGITMLLPYGVVVYIRDSAR